MISFDPSNSNVRWEGMGQLSHFPYEETEVLREKAPELKSST